MRLTAPCRWCLVLSVLSAAGAGTAWGAVPKHAEALLARSEAWVPGTVAAIGKVRAGSQGVESAGNILAVYVDRSEPLTIRVSLVAPIGLHDHVDHFARGGVRVAVLLDDGDCGTDALPAPLTGRAPFAWDRRVELDRGARAPGVLARAGTPGTSELEAGAVQFHLERGWLAATLPAGAGIPSRICVITYTAAGRELDRVVAPLAALPPTGQANVAFMHHGNQGLSHSDVFHGRFGAEATSGFDEVLRVHEQKNIPGNFHLGALLQSAAEWDARSGDPVDFNAWLRTGVTAGWAGMLTSPYGQPIMPFLQGAMNDWAIDRDVAMVTTRYNYVPHVAWVPERVFLNPGSYPNAGVLDWSGSHWQAHGVNGVILDDYPHCAGHDNHRIHFLQGNGLRIIPRDGNFTNKLHTGDGAGALQVLTDLANSGLGQYRIALYADDWEMAAEMGNWENVFPNALETYQWMIDKCQTESAWLHTWKLDAALANPDFNGDTFSPTYGTYGGIGDVNGYGGSNNAWYTHWAGFVPYVTGGDPNGIYTGTGGNGKNHGQLWNDAHLALQNAPNNNLRETGWYVLMTNLHETAWHDYLGGPLSGWERQYSAKIKNAGVYAAGASWAGGLYVNPTGAYFADIDNDGNFELVIYNDRVFAVFESIGGRCTHLFAKGSGYDYSVVGIDNAYWAGTEGDYNDVNHIAALSDVGPNYQNDLYAMSADVSAGNTVRASFTRGGVKKTVSLTLGQPYLNCIYRVGSNTQYLQSGFSPDVVDLLYNARMDRVWGGGVRTYMGQRNPNTAATGAYVLGNGGASHNVSLSSTLMKADEIVGTQKFQFYLYAGATSPPDGGGHIAELEALSAGLGDQLPPEAVNGTYFPATHQLTITFDEPVRSSPVVLTGLAIDADNNGSADVTLDAGCSVLTTGNAATLTIQVSNAVHVAIQALPDHNGMRLMASAGAVQDVAGNPIVTLTNAGNVPISYGPPTGLTLDGRFDPNEWPGCTVAVADSFDSQWNAAPNNVTNEIQAVYATWDTTYLYLGIRGVVTSNSWLLYLDTDPGGPNGQTDLRNTNAWERGATFSAPGFKPDWVFGAYQHQGPFDSQSFFRLTGPTTSADSTAAILKAFDPTHGFGLNGGSELAIPWRTLYGLAPGHVPANAQLGLVASLAYDPEPGGELGGDQAPNNLSATPPALDNRKLLVLDANGDGIPDPIDRTPPSLVSAVPTGYDSVIVLQFNEPLITASANQPSRYTVYRTASPGVFLTVKAATLQPNRTTVNLIVSSMSYVPYTVTVSGVSDSSCFRNVLNQGSTQFQGPPVSVDPTRTPLASLSLAVPAPNPTPGGRAVFEYQLPMGTGADQNVALELYDLNGRLVRTVVRGPQLPGVYRIAFDGTDDRGERLAAGVYFVRLCRGASQQIRRLVIMP